MSDPVRAQILAEALLEIPESGISDAALAKAAARAGAGKRELAEAFPQGPESLMEAFSDWADAQMIVRMADDPAQKVSQRIKNAVKARIEALIPYRAAARRAAAFLALPQHAPLAAKLTLRSVDAMWRAADDKASDFSYYTKRATLSAVYGSTLLYWLSQSGEPIANTWAFLDKRIENVMAVEKFKHAAREAAAKIPNPFAFSKTPRG